MARKLSRANPLLHLFSGEDREIIGKLNYSKINRNFNIIGFSVIFILCLCFVSAVIFSFNILTGIGKAGSIPIGIFWGFAVTTIYLLLLYTISPPLLVDKKMFRTKTKGMVNDKKRILFFLENFKRFGEWLTLSMWLRIIFIALFAIITIQPFNVMLFSGLVENEINLYKSHYKSEIILETDRSKIKKENEIVEEYLSKVHLNALQKFDSIQMAENITPIVQKLAFDNNFLNSAEKIKSHISNSKIKRSEKDDEIVQLNLLIEDEIYDDQKYLDSLSSKDPYTKFDFENFKNNFDSIIKEKAVSNDYISDLIDNNSFYIRKIIVINTLVPAAIILNLLSLVLFLFPIFLKFQIRKIKPKTKDQSFYYFKKEKEEQVVNQSYRTFKKNFEEKFQQRQHRTFRRISEKLRQPLEKLKECKPDSVLEIERNLIIRFHPYTSFSRKELIEKYGFTVEELHGIAHRNEIRFYEKYLDPPFNLKPRERKIIELSGQNLIDDVWRE